MLQLTVSTLKRLEPGTGSLYFRNWVGSGWGKDSRPYFLRQFYPNNPRPNNGNKRKNARTETVSAVRSSQSITAVTLTLSKILTSNTSTRGFCNSNFHFCGFCLSLCSCQAGTNQWSVHSCKLTNYRLLCFWSDRGFVYYKRVSSPSFFLSCSNPLL